MSNRGERMTEISITTANSVTGKELGIVTGSYVASKAFYKDWFAGIRNFLGWEIIEYTQLLEKSRAMALQRMKENAEDLGATKIVNVRFATAQTTKGAAEILAYGTAMKK